MQLGTQAPALWLVSWEKHGKDSFGLSRIHHSKVFISLDLNRENTSVTKFPVAHTHSCELYCQYDRSFHLILCS